MSENNFPDTYVAVDLETTGLSPENDRILEIGAVKIEKGQVTDTFCTFVDPEMEVPERIRELTGISTDMVKGQPGAEAAFESFAAFCGDMDLMGHNLPFDYSFLKVQAVRQKLPFEKRGIDTLQIARGLLADLESRSLSSLCSCFGIQRARAHRALDDAMATHQLYLCLRQKAKEEALFLPKPLMYRPKRQSPATISQKRYLKDLIKYHRIELDMDPDRLTKSEASRMIDRIILNYGKCTGRRDNR